MSKRLTTEEFIQRARKVHGNRYDYSLINYIKSTNKVKIICHVKDIFKNEHGIFEQEANSHLQGICCPKCSQRYNYSNDEFIKIANNIHNNKYDYSKVKYINSQTKVCIICHEKDGNEKEHGEFWQKPNSHTINKNGCLKCGFETLSELFKHGSKKFIEISNEIHNNKYDYSLVVYKNGKTKVKIICPSHGIFEQISNDHLRGSGCPVCKTSKGELTIFNFLKSWGIDFIRQYKFDDCRGIFYNKSMLPFDFFLKLYNLLIEFDGRQHFEIVDFSNGKMTKEELETQFRNTQRNDSIKNQYCFDHHIRLLRIPYWELKNIEIILKKELNFI